MKFRTSSTQLALTITLGTCVGVASVAPSTANAEVTANAGVANLYLFRGANLSGSNPQVFGGLDYNHATGFYAGAWASSESASGTELDLYAGFANEVEGFSYDLGILAYEYPNGGLNGSSTSGNDFGDFSEVYLNLGYNGFGLSLVDGLQGSLSSDPDSAGADYSYYSLSYDADRFGILVGQQETDRNLPEDVSHTHVDFSFYATDELTVTLSQVVDSEDGSGASNQQAADDLLFVVSWAKEFDIE